MYLVRGGSDNFVLLGEVGYVNVVDMPDPDVIRLNAPGTAHPSVQTINGNSREGLHQGLSDGPETHLRQTTRGAIAYWRLLITIQYSRV